MWVFCLSSQQGPRSVVLCSSVPGPMSPPDGSFSFKAMQSRPAPGTQHPSLDSIVDHLIHVALGSESIDKLGSSVTLPPEAVGPRNAVGGLSPPWRGDPHSAVQDEN